MWADYGEHCLIVYPDLLTVREFYSHYTKRMIKEKNSTVLVAPCYETTAQVRQILSENSYCLDVAKYENEDVLTIVDSMEAYFGKDKVMESIEGYITRTKEIGKSGFSAVADVGVFVQRNKIDELVDIELTLPTKFNIPYKRFCIYHQRDFDRLTEEQKENLIRHHSRVIRIT